MVAVFPGTADTLARLLRLNILLIRDDFPTLDRPAKAISSLSDGGSWEYSPYARANSALLKFIVSFSFHALRLIFPLNGEVFSARPRRSPQLLFCPLNILLKSSLFLTYYFSPYTYSPFYNILINLKLM